MGDDFAPGMRRGAALRGERLRRCGSGLTQATPLQRYLHTGADSLAARMSFVSGNVAVAIVSGLLAGGFALLGGAVTTWTATKRERSKFRTETALELAGMERLIWADDWVELNVHLQRHEARLTVAGVADDLVRAFHDISIACWRDNRESLERSGGEDTGINVTLMDARRLVHAAVSHYLLRGSVPAVSQTEAVTTTRAAIDARAQSRRS